MTNSLDSSIINYGKGNRDMLRKDIELYMKQHKLNQIDLVINKEDKLAVYCSLQGGTLKDYTSHVVDRKKDIWGYLKWENGKAQRIAWQGIWSPAFLMA